MGKCYFMLLFLNYRNCMIKNSEVTFFHFKNWSIFWWEMSDLRTSNSSKFECQVPWKFYENCTSIIQKLVLENRFQCVVIQRNGFRDIVKCGLLDLLLSAIYNVVWVDEESCQTWLFKPWKTCAWETTECSVPRESFMFFLSLIVKFDDIIFVVRCVAPENQANDKIIYYLLITF
jgi:hypothetical protein